MGTMTAIMCKCRMCGRHFGLDCFGPRELHESRWRHWVDHATADKWLAVSDEVRVKQTRFKLATGSGRECQHIHSHCACNKVLHLHAGAGGGRGAGVAGAQALGQFRVRVFAVHLYWTPRLLDWLLTLDPKLPGCGSVAGT